MFETLDGHVLGLVDDNKDFFPFRDETQEVAIELIEEILMGAFDWLDSELTKNCLNQFRFRQAWIEDQSGFHFLILKIVEQAAAEGGFSTPYFSSEDDETLLFVNPVAQVL